MSNSDDKSKASILDAVAFLVLFFLGVFALWGLISEEYSVPIWVYIAVGGAIIYVIYRSSQLKKVSSQSSSRPAYQKSGYETTKKPSHKSSYQPGEDVETNIVGVTFEGRQSVIARLSIGDGVLLEREPDNPYDPNAIKVLVHRYSKTEQVRMQRENSEYYSQMINPLSDQRYKLIGARYKLDLSLIDIKYGRDFSSKSKDIEDRIIEVENEQSRLQEESDKLHKEWDEANLKTQEIEQAGYINQELANIIAPIFDQWAVEPATKVDGKVIRLTGRDKQDLPKGAIIRFRLPDEYFLRNAVYEHDSKYWLRL